MGKFGRPNIRKLEYEHDVRSLTRILSQEKYLTQDKLAAIRALGRIGHCDAVGQLIDVLRYGEPSIREAAAIALGEIGDSRAVGPLIRSMRLKNNPLTLRLAAVKALGKIRTSDAVKALNVIQNDENEEVEMRRVAAEALERISKHP